MPDAQSAYDYRSSAIDEDRRRAKEVEARVERNRRDKRARNRSTLADGDAEQGGAEDDAAARAIQGRYREHVERRSKQGCNLSASDRWSAGIQQRRMSAAANDQDEGKNDPTSRWQRGHIYAAKLTEGKAGGGDGGDGELSAEEEMEALGRNDKEKKRIEQERQAAKVMEGQYYLELVDRKHRYASNLKYYHQRWNGTDTDDNFFHWLDEGEGKDFDLEQCPRKRLESERITYLNAEQRELYRVTVSDTGLLVWAKDGQPVDTSKYHKDRGPEHGGIVEISEEEYEEERKKEDEKLKASEVASDFSRSSSSSSSSSSSDEADEIREGAKAYGDKGGTAGQGKGVRQAKERVKYYLSPGMVMDTMLRKTVNKNTWLYVSDLKNNLYIGIKKTGSFQHSSFLYGARVTSAGLIKVHKGHLTSLSPLSGHYRAGTMHFKAFVRALEEQGVDMSHVSISKSVMTIRGIEKYGKFNKKKKALKERMKNVFTHAPSDEQKQADEDEDTAQRIRKKEMDGGDNARGKDALGGEGRTKREEEGGKDKRLPGEGKKPEEMTEEERMERGVALVQRAFERGLGLRDEREEDE